MSEHLFTIVCDFRGGTYVSQVRASDAQHAARKWAELLRRERPVTGCSSFIANNATRQFRQPGQPAPLAGLSGVWCLLGHVGGDCYTTNIIKSDREWTTPQAEQVARLDLRND